MGLPGIEQARVYACRTEGCANQDASWVVLPRAVRGIAMSDLIEWPMPTCAGCGLDPVRVAHDEEVGPGVSGAAVDFPTPDEFVKRFSGMPSTNPYLLRDLLEELEALQRKCRSLPVTVTSNLHMAKVGLEEALARASLHMVRNAPRQG